MSKLRIQTFTMGEVTTVRLSFLLALALGCDVAHAACEIEPGHYGPKLSAPAAKIRNDFYQIECIRAGGRLVDSTDPTLRGRLGLPRVTVAPSSEPYRQFGIRLGIRKSPILAYILDTSGSVQNVEVIESSGNKQYDAAIVALLRRLRWTPATLDGRPIPSLAYLRYDIGRPP